MEASHSPPPTTGLLPTHEPARTDMAVLELAMQGLAVFGFILFFVLWLMHVMSIIYV